MDELSVRVRHLQLSDFDDLREGMRLSYATIDVEDWERRHMKRLLDLFPDGQLCVEVNGKAVGCALSIIVDYSKFGDAHTYEQITAEEEFSTHDEEGDVLYGIEVFVHPDYRGMRLARRMYDARKELCENLNLRAIVAGGRIPGYGDHAEELTPKQYIDKVKGRELHDPILSFQLANDFHVKKLLRGYLRGDHESKAYATLLEWNNIYYEEKPRLLAQHKREIRLGVVQLQNRAATNLETVLDQAEYFIDTVSDYESDFIMFPEFFNAALMVKYNHLSQAEAIRHLAGYTDEVIGRMQEFAVSYNVNIIPGSMPLLEDGYLYNAAWFCGRDGKVESIKKLHITPSERDSYGMIGGNELRAIDTDCGKIGILICYDVEFPELPRLLREQGAEILFVPFMTDLQTGYNRVRFCAQARAVENECFVVIGGSVGNLPRVDNMDIQYSQSAVFSPSDFAFHRNGIVAEATPNTEMVLIADVNMDLLKELHANGSVTNLKDRRTDLYSLRLKTRRQPAEAKPAVATGRSAPLFRHDEKGPADSSPRRRTSG
ncbi:MAG: GNAT family N-acetyltransferase [Opitutales bacterium]